MSDRIEWNIEECRQVAIGLNQQGTLVKNALAGIYNTFRYKISGVWSGKNYNKVVEYVNGFAPDFKSITEYLGVTVPEAIKEIVNAQAANSGIYESFSLASDGNNPDIWTVELSDVSSDGTIKINTEAVNQYILGSQYPSVSAALDLALQYFNNYVNIFEQNLASFNNNEAIMVAYNTIQNYRSKFESDTTNMVDTIVDAANQEISGIEDINLKTRQDAQKIGLNSSTPNAPGGSSSTPNAPGGSYTPNYKSSSSESESSSGGSSEGSDSGKYVDSKEPTAAETTSSGTTTTGSGTTTTTTTTTTSTGSSN